VRYAKMEDMFNQLQALRTEDSELEIEV